MAGLKMLPPLSVCIVAAACTATAPIEVEPPLLQLTEEEMRAVELAATDFAHGPECNGPSSTGMLVSPFTGSARGLLSDEGFAYRLEADVWSAAKPLIPRLREINVGESRAQWTFADASDVRISQHWPQTYKEAVGFGNDARCAATLLRPALSSDGMQALVVLRVVSPHGDFAIYNLRREGSAWRIESHAYIDFL
jgi:hypothetical protein